jgi:hypothetical protein
MRHRTWIQLETYIFDLHGAGAEVAEALIRAARRGVTVQVLVDGIGTSPLPAEWRDKFAAPRVDWFVYSPLGTGLSGLGLLVPERWRRLHRKLCVVDQHLLFCGGINVLDDFYDPNHGELQAPRVDFAVLVTGPLAWRLPMPWLCSGGACRPATARGSATWPLRGTNSRRQATAGAPAPRRLDRGPRRGSWRPQGGTDPARQPAQSQQH